MLASAGHAPRTVGRYILYGELAAGGMATVHFGRLSGPVGFSRTVAIKRLHPQFAKDPEFVTMFLDEARLCGRIRHPNVVPTLDVVATEGEIFIVMEYVAGESLAKLLRASTLKKSPPPPRVVATILSSVLHGLHAAHQTKDEHGRDLGIVHRDVSPQNILVGADGSVRVLDFGVAKAAGRTQTTREGQVKGKIAYMPPEQLSNGEVTLQTDIYAAAVVLWEALVGRRLFDGETEAIVLVRAIEGKIDPPSRERAGLSPEIDQVVLRGLARDPAKRFKSAREMALALEQTIGLASPSEVGAWVEGLASTELARRATRVAEIESASATLSTTFTAEEPAPPHSQVSSLSVSRSAISTSGIPARKGSFAKKFAAIGGALGLCGLGLLGFTYASATDVTRKAVPRAVDHAARSLSVIPPVAVPGRATSQPTKPAASSEPFHTTPRVAPPSQTPAVVTPPKRPSCDPPYTVDQATGHKKYKAECFGR